MIATDTSGFYKTKKNIGGPFCVRPADVSFLIATYAYFRASASDVPFFLFFLRT